MRNLTYRANFVPRVQDDTHYLWSCAYWWSLGLSANQWDLFVEFRVMTSVLGIMDLCRWLFLGLCGDGMRMRQVILA